MLHLDGDWLRPAGVYGFCCCTLCVEMALCAWQEASARGKHDLALCCPSAFPCQRAMSTQSHCDTIRTPRQSVCLPVCSGKQSKRSHISRNNRNYRLCLQVAHFEECISITHDHRLSVFSSFNSKCSILISLYKNINLNTVGRHVYYVLLLLQKEAKNILDRSCHLVLMMSFATRVCAVVIWGKYEVCKPLPINLLDTIIMALKTFL